MFYDQFFVKKVNLALRRMHIHINRTRIYLEAGYLFQFAEIEECIMPYLRYMNGKVPLGRIALYTLSSARLMRGDSTRRSVEALMIVTSEDVKMAHVRLINNKNSIFFAW